MTRFEGRVSQVFGTSQRPRPRLTPIVLGAFAVGLAFVLPYVLAWTPVIVLTVLAYLWLRSKGWLRGGYRLPRSGERADAGLQITSFRVQIYDADHRPFRSLDCRIVQSAEAGPAPIVGDEAVVGHGYRIGRGLVELSGLQVGGAHGTRLRPAHPRSSTSILFPSLVLYGIAAIVVYLEWDVIKTFNPRAAFAASLQVLVCVAVIAVLLKFFRSRFRL
ncbi:hypothetical protein [Kineococcus sp. SYSU DK005]|uniref:hypothetical protein n=1 Tax=Kineococcus sp. SYSU DK005 TaxID=3383126 RepID=UPI003D7C80B4